MPRIGPTQGLVPGIEAAYRVNALRDHSEQLAAASDERRRLEIMRRQLMADPNFGGDVPQPNLNAGLRMPASRPTSQSQRDAGTEQLMNWWHTPGPRLTEVDPQADINGPFPERQPRLQQQAPNNVPFRDPLGGIRDPNSRLGSPRQQPGVKDPTENTARFAYRISNSPGGARQTSAPQQAGRAEEVAAMLRANGITVTSVTRSTNARRGGHDQGNSIDVAPQDEARALQLIQQNFPDLASELIPIGGGQRFGVGADGREVVSSGRHGHIDLGPAAGGAAPQQGNRPPQLEQIYAAVQAGPQGTAFAVRQLEDQRMQAVAMMRAARAAGIPEQVLQARSMIYEANNQMLSAYGIAAALDISQSGNTEAWSSYLLNTTGRQITFQPIEDGTYEIYVDGVLRDSGVSAAELSQNAMAAVDSSYAERAQSWERMVRELTLRSNLTRTENYERALLDNMTQTEVARIRAEAVQQTGADDVEFEKVLMNGEERTVAVYTDPQTGERVMSPIESRAHRLPGTNRTEDRLQLGPPVPFGGGM